MKTPILGTGLSGLIGTRFQKLYGDNYDFNNLDLTTGVDITNAQSVDEAISQSNAESVIHLAAFTNVSAAFEQKDDKNGVCYQVNVVGTENIANACQKHGKYLIHISTDYVFDGTKESPYVEEDEPHPIEWYGQTKYMAEQIIKESLENYVILRPAFPYQSRPMRPDFLAKMIENLQNNTLPPAFTDHIVTPTFADDWAKIFDYCIRNHPTGLYHATGSSWHSDYQMAQMVKKTFNLQGEVKEGNLEDYLKTINRPYQKTMKVSNAKLVKDFGITPKTFEQGLIEIKQQLS